MTSPIQPSQSDPGHPYPSYGELQAENARLREDLDCYREQYVRAETALVGIHAVLDLWREPHTPKSVDEHLDEAQRRREAGEQR